MTSEHLTMLNSQKILFNLNLLFLCKLLKTNIQKKKVLQFFYTGIIQLSLKKVIYNLQGKVKIYLFHHFGENQQLPHERFDFLHFFKTVTQFCIYGSFNTRNDLLI